MVSAPSIAVLAPPSYAQRWGIPRILFWSTNLLAWADSPISYAFRIMALSVGVPGENILLFTWHHVHHIGVPKQWNGGYVAVPNQSCCVVELFSYVSLQNKRFWSSKCTKVCLIAKQLQQQQQQMEEGGGEGRRENFSPLPSLFIPLCCSCPNFLNKLAGPAVFPM